MPEPVLPPVSLAFGCAAIAGLYAPLPEAEARDTLEAAWQAGLRRYDTAPFYGLGLSERRVGDFLRDKPPGSFTLSTKVGRLLRPLGRDVASEPGRMRFDVVYDYSRDGILRSVEASHARLGLDTLDILYIHDIGRFAHPPAENDRHMRALLGSGLRALMDLKAEGVIRGWGLGVNEAEVCLQVMDHATPDEILLAGRYTLLDRTAEAHLLPRCVGQGVRLVIGGVFNSGILATGPVSGAHFDYAPASTGILGRVAAMAEVTARHGLTLAEAALNYPAGHPAVSHVLIGTGRRSSLQRNLAQFGTPLPEAMLAELEPFVLR